MRSQRHVRLVERRLGAHNVTWGGCLGHDPRDRAGAGPAIPGRRNRKRAIRYDQQRYRGRHLIENAFCRLKDFRRVATRYDKLAANFLSGVALATATAFWL